VKTILVFFIIIDLEFLTTVIHRFSPIFFSEITISDIAHKLRIHFLYLGSRISRIDTLAFLEIDSKKYPFKYTFSIGISGEIKSVAAGSNFIMHSFIHFIAVFCMFIW
jgi:hypothetical protein